MIPVKHFYMIRHGESAGNAAGIAAGHLDSPLTTQGRAEAATAVDIVDTLTIKPLVIYHSNLSRARDTAIILNQNLGLPLHENAKVAEQHFGDWQGQPWEIVGNYANRTQDPPYGESRIVFRNRVEQGLTEILSTPAAPVLIACHGGVFEAFGDIYNTYIHGIKNCQLYEFVPQASSTAFPWTVFRYGNHDGQVTREAMPLSPRT